MFYHNVKVQKIVGTMQVRTKDVWSYPLGKTLEGYVVLLLNREL